MVLERAQAGDLLAMVDMQTGLVDRRMFTDQQLYDLEMEQIYARAWLFLCHESQIPNAGDYFMTTMGEDRVIVVRDEDGGVQVLLNSCRHRGNAVCRADEGNVSSFMCTYHGWTYDLKGKLVGVPGFKEVYHEELDRDAWGLVTAAQVDSFKGFVFATMDPAAPSLDEYLGEVGKLGLNSLALHGDNQIVGGIQKYTIPCNWKFATDNIWDFYHGITTHASAYLSDPAGTAALRDTAGRYSARHLVFLGEYGHAFSGPAMDSALRAEASRRRGRNQAWRERPEALQEMGRLGIQAGGHPHIFPNMWLTGNQVVMRFPRGPHATEMWFFTLLDKSLSEQEHREAVTRANHTFGPAGLWEQDDGENWGQSTMAMRGVVSSKFPLHYGMNLGRGEFIDEEGGPPHIEARINEHAQLWFYRGWAEWMAARDWDELRDNHLRPEGRI